MKHYNITVTGTVQGVFFRDSTREKARELEVFGFVKNQKDGSVYIEVEGDDEQLKSFTNWLWQGPEKAQVADVKMAEGELQNFTNFEITY